MTKQKRILSAVSALAMTAMAFTGVVNAENTEISENSSGYFSMAAAEENPDPELIEKALKDWEEMNSAPKDEDTIKHEQIGIALDEAKTFINQIKEEMSKSEEYKFWITGYAHTKKNNFIELTVMDEETKAELIKRITEKGIDESLYKFVVDPDFKTGDSNVVDNGIGSFAIKNDTLITDPDTQKNIIYGDINDDGTADLTDLTLLSLYLMQSADFTDSQIEAADIDGNGEVDIADLAYFKQYICKDPNLSKVVRIK